jgi:tetratricopeptide (TPR) repeat protein
MRTKGFFAILFVLMFCGAGANTDSLKKILDTNPDDTSKINIHIQLAKIYTNKNTDSALIYAQLAYKDAKKSDGNEKQALAANVLGVVYLNRAQYDKALLYHFEAARLFEITGNKRGLSFSYNNIGSVNFHTGKYADALVYYKKALNLKQELKLTKEISSTYINIGNIFMKKEEYDSCIHYYHSALDIATQNSDGYNTSVSLMNLGEAYNDKKNYPLALDYYRDALTVNLDRGDQYHLANCYYAIGKIYIKTGNLNQAEPYLQKALDITIKGGMKSLQLNIYKEISLLYEKTGDYSRALIIYKKYHDLNDSIFSTENTKRIEKLRTGYESELKDRQILELNQDKALAEEKTGRERVFKNSLIIAFILSGIMIAVLYRNTLLKKRTNSILLEKNHQIELHQLEIEQKNNELAKYNKELMTENISVKYEVLKSKINPHFLFNSLSTLSTLIIKNQQQAIDFVGRFSKLYRSILKSGDNKLITLEEEMELASHYLYMQKMRFGQNLLLDIDIPVADNRYLIPPFTIQLLIENAIKHNIISEENRLIIEIKCANAEMTITNNLQLRPASEASTGIGQQNITDRYRLLGAPAPHFGVAGNKYIAKVPLLKTETAYELLDN